MSKLSPIIESIHGQCVQFWCPGCDDSHPVRVGGPGAWIYNGRPDAPSFSPSVKVTGTVMTPEGDALWAKDKAEGMHREDGFTYPSVATCCHSFITEGAIQFLGDCTHALVGQTVPLPEWDIGPVS